MSSTHRTKPKGHSPEPVKPGRRFAPAPALFAIACVLILVLIVGGTFWAIFGG